MNAHAAQGPAIIAALVTTLLYVLAVAGMLLRVRKLERTVEAILVNSRAEREHGAQRKRRLDELHTKTDELLKELNFVQATAKEIRGDVSRLNTQGSPPRDTPRSRDTRQPAPPPPPPYALRRTVESEFDDDAYETPRAAEDGLGRLNSVANQIVQQSSITLDAFRTNIGTLSARASAWPPGNDAKPIAFIVEYRGICYAVPNIVKPARLPEEWFNRSDFGVNDEIRRVESLPRLIRSGEKFEVAQAGVFAK